MPKRPGTHRPNGFTLIETLIVIVVLAIASALVVPMLGETDATKVRAAAQLVSADLGFAQIESISHGDDLRVVNFNLLANTYHIASASATGTPITNPVGNIPYTTKFGESRAYELGGVTLDSYLLGGDNILGFGIYGQLDQTTDATITLAAGPKKLAITVDATTGETSLGPVF